MNPPDHLLSWLTCKTHLTKALYAKSGDTKLKVVQQIWREASDWDQQSLGLSVERVLHRDIVMLAKDKPCWFARTILPESTYLANSALFERLKEEPLGNLIFQTVGTERKSIQYYPITPQHTEYAWVPEDTHAQAELLWVRSSVFQIASQDLFYLIEILLPELEQYC